MRISGISTTYPINVSKFNTVKSKDSYNMPVQQNKVPVSPLHFSGVFGKSALNDKKPCEDNDFGMNGNDYIRSFKVADVLHQLDEENILVIGKEDFWLKNHVASSLTQEDSKLKNPKRIKNVYLIYSDNISPLIIQKTKDNKFDMCSPICNLTNPDDTSKRNMDNSLKYHFYNYGAAYGDVIETENKLKIKFLELAGESNAPMYDAKYPVESFLTQGLDIKGGFVVNKPQSTSSAASTDEDKSNTEYGRAIPYRTFDDIAGLDDAVKFMKRKLMYPIMYPNAFKEDKNKGIILSGPTGTGKTLLALATIGEIKKRQNKNVHFVKINSRDLENRYVGVSEERWRNVFAELQSHQPAILFIDEIDSLMQDRDSLKDNSHNSQTSIVSQLLQSIDELEKTNAQVWIIGATNRPNAIDRAIKRSGRLGDIYEVNRPDADGCRKIFDLYTKDKNLEENFDKDMFAHKCYDMEYTGADIAQIVSEARNKMYERCGIFDRMDDDKYTDSDLNGLIYTQEDFLEAVKEIEKTKSIKK